MCLLVLVAIVGVCCLEAYVAVLVAGQIGAAATAILLVVCSIGGLWLVRREGSRAWYRLQDALRQHRSPAPAITDAALLLVGGALIAFPGFVTTALGLLVVLPVSRPLVRAIVVRGAGRRRPVASRPRDTDVIEGEVVDDSWDEPRQD